ncbi:MAG: gamma-glutamyltransferase [Chloroflexi bacterium]|nr:gamma-glutamyltransferase [Chloroflexota bacterium]
MATDSLFPAANRPAAIGANGMVASAHPLASMAGLRILQDGGNAFDAAVAVASVLNVGEPYMSGVGGIGLALVYVAKEDRVRVLNFSGRAPKAATPDKFSHETVETGMLAPMVPGNVAGWLTLHETYGSLDRERLFQQAIDYAEDGMPVTTLNSRMMAQSASRLSKFPSAPIILGDNGRPPRPGTKLRMPQLAQSLRTIVKGGKDVFYKGELAERIVKGSQELGGLFTMEDMAEYEPQWQEPIRIGYRDYEVYTTPPNSSGFQILQTLKLLEGYGRDRLVFQSPEALHLMMEAVKLCTTDRIRYAGDPDVVDVPVRGLLSDEYAAKQRRRIDPESAALVSGEHYSRKIAAEAIGPGNPEEFDGGMTTHFAVADRDGNVVSVTQTLGGGFGSAVAPGDTGIFLNNMCYWFDLEEGSPNLIGPGVRVDFVVAPTHTFKNGKFYASMGTPGSWGILQTTVQFLMHLLDFGMDPQEAIEAPRFRYFTGRRVEMEERFPIQVRRALEGKGHEVAVVEPWSMSVGGAQGIRFLRDEGVFQGGADPRRDGLAIGW